MELVALAGTVKQISWAKNIRRERLKVWQGEDSSRFKSVESMLYQQGMASWWIANKGKSLEEVCKVLHGGTTAKTEAPKPVAKNTVIGVAAVPKVDTGRTAAVDEDGVTRVVTAKGFIQVGPTRDRWTGELVVDDSLPF